MKKELKKSSGWRAIAAAIAFSVMAGLVGNGLAAEYERVTGAGTWTGTGSEWENTAGSGGFVNVPTGTDDALLDANSGELTLARETINNLKVTGNGWILSVGELTVTNTLSIEAGGSLQIGNGANGGSVVGDIVNNGTLAFLSPETGASPYVITNSISGTGVLRFKGTGTDGQSSYQGDATDSIFNGIVIVENNARLELVSSSTGTGSGITVENGGSLWLENGVTYSSPITIAGDGWHESNGSHLGALRMGGDSIVTAGVTLAADSRIGVINSSGTITGVIGGGMFGVEKTGSGTLILSGSNTYGGGTTVSGGTLQLGDGGTTGSIMGNIVNNTTVVFNRSNASTFDGVISGAGTVVMSGTGTLTLTANNTYIGGTTVAAGTLAGSGTNAGSLTVENGGTFAVSSDTMGNYTGISFAGTGTFDSGSRVDMTGIKKTGKFEVFDGDFTDQDAANAAITGNYSPLYTFSAYSLGGFGVFEAHLRDYASISDAYVNALQMHHYRTVRDAGSRHLSETRSNASFTGNEYRGQAAGRNRGVKNSKAWVNYIGRTNRLESHFYGGQEAKFETNGVQLGYDLFAGRCTQFGVLFGYEDHQQRLGDLGDNVKSNDYYLGIYGERKFGSCNDLRGFMSYGHQNYDLRRIQNGVRHAADFDGNTFEANFEIGCTFYRNRCFSFRPVVALDFFSNALDSARENNGGIGYSQASLTQTFVRLGSDFNWTRNRWGINGGAYYSYQMASNGDVLRTQITNGGDTLWAYGSDLGNSVITLNAGGMYYVNCKQTCAVFANYYADFYTDRDGSPMQNTALAGIQKRF